MAAARAICGSTLLKLAIAGSALLAFASGCARPATAQDVADHFWRAVLSQDPAKVRRFVRSADRQSVATADAIIPISSYELRRTVIEGERATVDTQVVLADTARIPLEIQTVLAREGEQWRVDYPATMNELSSRGDLAGLLERMQAIRDALKKGANESLADLSKAIPQVEEQLSRIESEIKQRMPELRRQMEELTKRLRDALKQPHHDRPAPAAPGGGTIAI